MKKKKKYYLVCIVLTFFLYFYFLNTVSAGYQEYMRLDQPAIYYKTRGDYYRYIGLTYNALNAYDKAIFLKPDYIDCYYLSALLYAQKELYTQALYQIAQALQYKRAYYSLSTYCNLAFLEINIFLRRKESLSLVENKLDALLKFLSNFESKIQKSYDEKMQKLLQYQQGKVYFYKGKYLTGFEMTTRFSWIDIALKSNYESGYVLYFLHLLYTEYNENAKAKHALDQAIKLNSNIISEYYAHGEFEW